MPSTFPLGGMLLILTGCALSLTALIGSHDARVGAAAGGGVLGDPHAAALATLRNAGVLGLLLSGVLLVAARARALVQADAPPVVASVRRLNLVAALMLTAQTLLGAAARYQVVVETWNPGGAEGGGRALAWAHGLGALLTALALLAAATLTVWQAAGRPWLRGLAGTVLVLALAQTLLGLLGGADLRAHIGVGVALFANTWGMYVASAAGRAAAAPPIRLRDLIALSKPRVTLLVFLTFAAGRALAPAADTGAVTPWLLAALATWLLVAAANALNMFAEREHDRHMRRTAGRPLPAGRLDPDVALAMGTLLACVALPLLAWSANGLTALLGLCAFVSYVFLYTPLKRVSWTALLVGALPGALPPLMGWTAATGRLDAGGLALFAVLFGWQVPHFIAIGLMRGDDYARAGYRILTVDRGEPSARRWALGFAVGTAAASLALPLAGVGGPVLLAAAVVLGVLFARSARLPARPMFFWSLGYLVLLHAALGLDRLVAAVWS